MSATGQDLAWKQRAEDQLNAAGYRRGGARTALLELLDEQSCARTAFELEAELQARERGAARATIYRVLDQLEQLRLVQRIEVGQGVTRYERVASDHHHHHLVCTSCGSVSPFTDDQLETAIDRLSSAAGFRITGHDVLLHGICAKCSAKGL